MDQRFPAPENAKIFIDFMKNQPENPPIHLSETFLPHDSPTPNQPCDIPAF
jgi:hypothetical protein